MSPDLHIAGASYACAAQSRRPVETWRRPWRAVVDMLRVWRRPARLADPDAAKRAAPCWAPHTLRDGGTRTLADVVELSALVLDYDHEPEGPEAIAARWRPYEVYVYTTWRSTLEAPRCRAVLPLAAPIAADVWRTVYAMVLEGIGVGADPACADPTRIHVLPIVGPAGDARACHLRGRPVDLRPYAEHARAAIEAQAAERRTRELAALYRRQQARPWERRRVDLAHDPDARARWAIERGGKTSGESAKGVPCPKCGDRSVWWPLRPEKMTGAACAHRNSCGWTGRLEDL